MMVTEGLARSVSPELIRTLATAIPILVAGWWMLVALGRLWRRSIWQEVGGAIERMAATTGGVVRPCWFGWRVEAGETRVTWLSGLLGPRTIVKSADKTQEHPGLLTSSELSDLHG